MVARLFDALFGCWHSHYSFPLTVRPGSRRNRAAALTGTYVVCLNCGKELPYDWQEMRIVTSSESSSIGVRSLATKQTA
jgi:RNA polymerase subunit RPABC4/transcription elongation factor Spt4